MKGFETMKTRLKTVISIALCAVMLLNAGALVFPVIAEAGNSYTTSGLAYEVDEENKTVAIVGSNPEISGAVEIPNTIEGYPVTTIKDNAFPGGDSITSLSLPANLSVFEPQGYFGLQELISFSVSLDNKNYCAIDGVLFNKDKSILLRYPSRKNTNSYTIPDTVKTIGEKAFNYTSVTENITIPKSVITIERGGFDCSTGLKSVYYKGTISDWCKIQFLSYVSNPLSYAKKLYIDNKEIKNISEDDLANVTKIGKNTFYSFDALESISIPSSVISIEENAFAYCKNLTSITFADDSQLEGIGNYAFMNCIELPEIKIPDSVKSIGNLVFDHCNNLKSITIPKIVSSIGNQVFRKCINLTRIEVSNENSSFSDINGVLFNKEKTKLICYPYAAGENYTVPAGVECIGMYAFNCCDGLKSVDFSKNEKLSVIESCAFEENRGIETIRLPYGVKTIGGKAFSGNSKLSILTIPGSVTEIGNYAFSSCIKLRYFDFYGTEQQWKSVIIDSYYKDLKNAKYDVMDGFVRIYKNNSTGQTCSHAFTVWQYEGNPYDGQAFRNRSCKKCGYAELETIGPLSDVKRLEKSGVSATCENNTFDEGTDIEVRHYSNSDIAKDIIDETWYISFIKNGEEVQPQTPVLLKFELPAGISDESKSNLKLWHYYNGEWILLNTWFDGNYMYCVTDCFSPFAITDNGKAPEKLTDNDSDDTSDDSIKIKVPASQTINWRYKAKITASAENLPAGCFIQWFDGTKPVGDKGITATYTTGEMKEEKTYTAKIVDENGNVISTDSQNESVTIKVNSGFFTKIISFFRAIFGGTPTITL